MSPIKEWEVGIESVNGKTYWRTYSSVDDIAQHSEEWARDLESGRALSVRLVPVLDDAIDPVKWLQALGEN